MKIATIGIDLAKAVIQIHGVDERSKLVAKQAIICRHIYFGIWLFGDFPARVSKVIPDSHSAALVS